MTTSRKEPPKQALMWGLGMEHELAPAVLTPAGIWQKIRPQKLNAIALSDDPVEPPPSAVKFVNTDKLTYVPVLKGTTSVTRYSSNMRSVLAWGIVIAVENGVSFARSPIESDTPLPKDGLAHHRTMCGVVASIAKEIAKARGFKRVSMTIELQEWTRIFVYPERGGLALDELEEALYASTAGIVFRKNMVTRVRGVFEIDSGFIEIKSEKPVRATIGSIAGELDAREREVVAAAKKVAVQDGLQGTVGILPHGQVVLDDSPSISMKPTYAGSYHVWITLPHVTGPKFDHDSFVKDHAVLVRALQWMEPLMLACMPCDPRCPGMPSTEYSRASLRSRMNGLSGFGTGDMSAKPAKRPVMCYASLDALNAGDKPMLVETDDVSLVTKDGTRLNLMACQQSHRYDESRGVADRWEDGTGFPIHNAGNDVRYLTCWSCDGGETHHSAATWVEKTSAFIKTKDGIRVAVLDDKTGSYRSGSSCVDGKPIGIEFRIFDHVPGEFAKDLLSTVVLVAAAASAMKSTPAFAAKDAAWMLQMRDCAAHGSRVPVSKAYWAALSSVLGVPAGKLPATAYDAMNAVLTAMHRVYKGSKVAKLFGYAGPVKFPDVNFPAWKDGLLRKLQTDTVLAGKVRAFVDAGAFDVKHVDAALGRGWRDDLYMLKALADTR